MKYLLFLILISNSVSAQMILRSRAERTKNSVTQTVKLKQSALEKKSAKTVESKKVNVNDEIDALLAQAEKRPNIQDYSSTFNINTGTVIKGRLLNSILSTNLLSPVNVEVTESSQIPVGSRLICKGSTKHKRVHTFCSVLVLPEEGGDEYDVEVTILNQDGSAGLRADHIYSGDTKYVVGQVAIEALKAAAVWDQTIATTAIGDRPVANDKNRLIGGLNGGLDAVGDIAQREFKTEEPKVVVYAGKEVLIYFEKRFKK